MTFHSVGNFHPSQLTNSYFSEGLKPPTRLIWDDYDHDPKWLKLPGFKLVETTNHRFWSSMAMDIARNGVL